MRLVVLPSIGMCFVLTAKHFGLLLMDDKMYIFVLLLQHTMPTSIQVGEWGFRVERPLLALHFFVCQNKCMLK
jgi:hypothetical protein